MPFCLVKSGIIFGNAFNEGNLYNTISSEAAKVWCRFLTIIVLISIWSSFNVQFKRKSGNYVERFFSVLFSINGNCTELIEESEKLVLNRL